MAICKRKKTPFTADKISKETSAKFMNSLLGSFLGFSS